MTQRDPLVVVPSRPLILKDQPLADTGWLSWDFGVTNEGGFYLTKDDAGTPYQAGFIEFFFSRISWKYSPASALIDRPDGNGIAASDGWRFPDGAKQFAIVFFERTSPSSADGNCHFVYEYGSPAAPHSRGVLAGSLLCFNVNDVRGTYADNLGSYTIWVRLRD